MEQEHYKQTQGKILTLFASFVLLFIVFVATLVYWTKIDRKLPRLQASQTDTALRGDIVSRDGFTMATSQKLYKAMVDTRSIASDKKELFVKMFSVYSGISQEEILKRLNSGKSIVTLSYQIDAQNAKYLQELGKKLTGLGVFVSFVDPVSGFVSRRGLDVLESGESRLYPHNDTFSPFLGYVKKVDIANITKVDGVKGVEGRHNQYLSPVQDKKIYAPRDIGNTMILNRDTMGKARIDGYALRLSVHLKLQKMVENIADSYKKELNAKEVIIGVMHAPTGDILTLASSNRFNPNSITKNDYPNLNASATEYIFEPGSAMKTILFALLLKDEKINPFDLVRTYGGVYRHGKFTIRDTKKTDWLSAEDVITHSSNIGSVQLSQKIDGYSFYEGLRNFGFSRRTGVDLPYENAGMVPSAQSLSNDVNKGSVAYGYGLQTNFMQILKAYNVFNNNGKLVEPRLGVEYIGSDKKYDIIKESDVQLIDSAVAKRIKRVLVKAVKQGTGTAAIYDGLEIGGKTGTAHISVAGKYENLYNGSFYGFANDAKNSFTIGILSIEPKKPNHYFGSRSAAPVFRSTVQALVNEGFLTPSVNDISE